MNTNTFVVQALPCPRPSLSIPLSLRIPVDQATRKPLPQLDPNAGRKALAQRRAAWAKLSLRQDWADETFMRSHLRAAGVRIPDNTEPATSTRMKSILRKLWITSPQIIEAVGTSIAGYLTLNPGLPLWAAVALILEATGRFTPKVSA
jgi:hypothetical protein